MGPGLMIVLYVQIGMLGSKKGGNMDVEGAVDKCGMSIGLIMMMVEVAMAKCFKGRISDENYILCLIMVHNTDLFLVCKHGCMICCIK